jgi:exodeoxyribonuclease VII large subunit
LHNRLLALNPAAIMQRGFALVQRPDGQLVHSVQQVQQGEEVKVSLSDGTLTTEIREITPRD